MGCVRYSEVAKNDIDIQRSKSTLLMMGSNVILEERLEVPPSARHALSESTPTISSNGKFDEIQALEAGRGP